MENGVNPYEVILQDLERPRLSPASSRGKFHKVPPILRDENKDHYYDPKVVSIGPYHHGNLKFQFVEEYKYKAMQFLVSEYTNRDITPYYKIFLDVIGDIRESYVEGSTDHYSDAELARIMFLDTCFLLNFMETVTHNTENSFMMENLGLVTFTRIYSDVLLLENQIPLWILKRLATSMYGNIGDAANIQGEKSWKELLGMRDEQCLDLLELYRTLIISECNTEPVRPTDQFLSTFPKCFRLFKKQRRNSNLEGNDFFHSFRSVRDLKSKCISFKPSSLKTLRGIKFKSYYLFGQLNLPSFRISTGAMARYANMIAYEMSPGTKSSYEITSYVNFMKSLVISAEDVKELREKKILFNTIGTDEEAVKALQEIPAGMVYSYGNLLDIREKIQQHIGSKKILLAELYWTYLRSPWSFTGLLVATALLGLTVVQTYFTIYPRK
ncbi:UPF0481 protein At3g47200-like [Lycium ferocissimum]|uniref:UPF0481 protein At3g47200-like n=1 Tax=Lycium ferocissimum TaxID=112874 RepID=UPI002815899A|nr:UPF0481 protein At3g47200-like [Lycium ferocissimum]